MKKCLLLLAASILLAGCAGGGEISSSPSLEVSSESSGSPDISQIENKGSVSTYVYVEAELPEVARDAEYYRYEGKDIRIEGNSVIGLKAGTSTEVSVFKDGEEFTITVNIDNRPYNSTHEEAEVSEGWFESVDIDPIAGLGDGFYNGMDVSSAYIIYKATAAAQPWKGVYYNDEGNEQSLFQILKEHGLNSVRLRLWVDPYNYNCLDADGNPTPYGGGICDYQAVEWMAKEAVDAGLEYCLDFHYSDYWADPGTQVFPKSWVQYETAAEVSNAIYEYTKGVLEDLKAANALPRSVQLGNETTGGMLLQYPGTDHTSMTGGLPYYSDEGKRYSAPSAVRAPRGSANLVSYLSSAARAVNEVDPSIDKIVHIAKGLSGTDNIIEFYNGISEVDYDVIGLSGYTYFQWGNLSTLRNGLTAISEAFPDKKILIAETAYGFTYENDGLMSPIFYKTTGSDCKETIYEVSPQGQAEMIRDVTAAVASLDNGYGVYYWEGAWKIQPKCGWSDERSTNSWANQGLFSYNGKATGALDVYQKIQPQQ